MHLVGFFPVIKFFASKKQNFFMQTQSLADTHGRRKQGIRYSILKDKHSLNGTWVGLHYEAG